MRSGIIHTPVLIGPVLEQISASRAGVLLDATVGEGGHSERILHQFPEITLDICDRNAQILEVARKRLGQDRIRHAYHCSFGDLLPEMQRSGQRYDIILMDLGISSYHFETSGLGFGLNDTDSLDMRLDSSGIRVDLLIDKLTERDLADLIYRFGEERHSRRIARAIVANRPIRSAAELARIILHAVHGGRKHRIHPATRTFQALRIAANRELDHLCNALCSLPHILAPGGRALIISFHSLEDRIVKWFFKRMQNPDLPIARYTAPWTFDAAITTGKIQQQLTCRFGTVLTAKPIIPDADELRKNPRCRSAKLRIFRRES